MYICKQIEEMKKQEKRVKELYRHRLPSHLFFRVLQFVKHPMAHKILYKILKGFRGKLMRRVERTSGSSATVDLYRKPKKSQVEAVNIGDIKTFKKGFAFRTVAKEKCFSTKYTRYHFFCTI